MVLAPRDRQLASLEADVASADAGDAQDFAARTIAAKDLDVGLGNAERFGQELLERFVRGALHGSRCERHFEGTILDSDDAIATRTRRNTDLEGDRPVQLSNA